MSKKSHARVKFPSNFKNQPPLVDSLILYKATLPTINWVSALEASSGITLAAIQGIGITAKGFDKLKDSNHQLSLNAMESRNNNSKPIVQHMEGGFQVIKTINAPDFGPLRFWGANVSIDGKINNPTNIIKQMAAFKIYSDYYATFIAGEAPIEFYQVKHEYIMANDVDAMTAANGFNTDALSFKAISENNTDLRNITWEDALDFLIKIYNVAKATFKDFYRELGLMGFDMSENALSHKDQISTALQGSQILVHGAIIGSVIENLNDFDVIIHPGEYLAKPPITFAANSIIAVKKGMSCFILENPDDVRIAKIRATVRRSR